ncbi:MalM family protein [uncultured Lamprocystis sp.]|jgi:maltose operon protein|uniref:MalM family protein n=1 Tax=uncultured Lamprocystis sp. TaxID=543132 RepID=UPI0025D0B080|nr:MalM family protein [uncultured Lamprocystis sp.]
MPRSLTVVLVLSLATLAGCAGMGKNSWFAPMESRSPMYTAVSPSAAASQDILNAAAVCCDALSDLRFAPLDTTTTRFYEINAASQAFVFSTGKSLLQAFSIPDDLERATLTIDAVAGATVFVPTVLILDRDFKVTRAIESSSFKYTPAGFMEPQRLRGRVFLDRRQGSELANEKYLVIFTTDKDLRGSTRMISEARLYARARGLADPGLPDPVARHAATGVFRMDVGELETAAPAVSRDYVKQQRGATRYVAPAPAATTATPKAATPPATRKATAKPTAPTKGPQPMLQETQRMYDGMIEESVSAGDMDRAWRLVQEAERAGSTSARTTFVTAVKNK